MTDHPAVELARKLRYDLTAMQTKVTDLLTILAAENLESPSYHECRLCRLQFAGSYALAEHLYHQHDGPAPAHWLEAEARAEDSA